MSSNRQNRTSTAAARAFTLVELLIVVIILIVLISLVLPALAAARTAARKASTQAILKDVSTAANSFKLSEQRQPGYFDSRRMADPANQARGFSAMENIMLDLAGGVVDNSVGLVGGRVMDVGPTNADTVRVDIELIGADSQIKGVQNKGYYVPPKELFVAHTQLEQQNSNQNHRLLPDLIDSFGQPVLAWSESEFAGENSDFAEINSSGYPQDRPYFYWLPNASFLEATSLGSEAFDQTQLSLLSRSGMGDQQVLRSLAGLLGNPAYPNADDPDVPAATRGGLTLHSAGADGVYFSKESQGGRIAMSRGGADAGVLVYDPERNPLKGFDDVTSSAGSN